MKITTAITTRSHSREMAFQVRSSNCAPNRQAVSTWASVFIRLSTRRTPSTRRVNWVTPSSTSSFSTCPSSVTTP